jgi:hypothetical protein
MTEDEYLWKVLVKYAPDRAGAERAAQGIAPDLQRWAGSQLAELTYSGSFAKGTANSLGTDVDLFISLKADTGGTLADIYNNLFRRAQELGWQPVQQNVSVRIQYLGKKVDLVPGRIQSGYQNYHSLYKRKSGSWTQTNVKLHGDTVRESGRTQEIRTIKIWRDLLAVVTQLARTQR